MELKKALEIRLMHNDVNGLIRINTEGYICLNDISVYYPNKRLQNWLDNDSTKDFIKTLENKLAGNGDSLRALVRKEGRSGGTYAHKHLAFKFCMWLSPELELHVIEAYEKGTQKKQDWNIKRILASEGFKIMTKAIKETHENAKFYHYVNETNIVNEIVFGSKESGQRDTATEEQLDLIAELEQFNGQLIRLNVDKNAKKQMVTDLYNKLTQKTIAA